MQYKCEECGNSIDIAGNGVFVVCDRCRKEQIVLKNNESKTTSSPEIQPLIKRVLIFIEDGEWAKADEYCEKILDINPECGEAYLGKFMSEFKAKKRSDLISLSLCISENNNYKKIMRFGDSYLIEEMRSVAEDIEKRKEQERKFTEQVRAEQLRIKLEEQRLKEYEREKTREEREKKRQVLSKKIMKIAIPIVALLCVVAVAFLCQNVFIPLGKYNNAVSLMEAGKYSEAISAFTALAGYKDSNDKISECHYRNAEYFLAKGEKARAAILFGQAKDYNDAKKRSLNLWNEVADRKTIFASDDLTLAVKSDGTVYETGIDFSGNRDGVGNWKDIVAVSVGFNHTVGLKANGTVVATEVNGEDDCGQCSIDGWKDIVAVYAGCDYTIGIKKDGTLVMTGDIPNYNSDKLKNWTDIIDVESTYGGAVVGLKADGTIVTTSDYIREELSTWSDIVSISAQGSYLAGVKSDGTVAFADMHNAGERQSDIEKWTDIVSVSVGEDDYVVGLKKDGTAVSAITGDILDYGQHKVEEWTDIVAISAGNNHTVGLKSDGTVVAIGSNSFGSTIVGSWENIKLP